MINNEFGKKNILFVTPYMETGGTEKVVYDLVKGMVSQGHAVYVASSGGRFVAELEKLGVRHIKIKSLRGKAPYKLFDAASKVQRIIKVYDIEIVNAHSYVSVVSVAIARFLYRTKFKHIFTLHIPEKDFYFKIMGMTLTYLVDRTVTVCQWTKSRLVESGANFDEIGVIYNGVDVSYFSGVVDKTYCEREIFNIGMVARLVGRKGHVILLRAVKKYIDDGASQKLCVHFYGDGPMKLELHDQVCALGLEEIVVFHGDTVDVKLAYQGLDLFVLPSYTEGFPLTILEAMSANVPVVATSVNGIPEVVINDETGLIFERGDYEALFYIIKQLIEQPELLKNLSCRAYELVSDQFDTDTMTDSYLRLFQSVLI